MNDELLNIADLRRRARKSLPRGIFDFVERGTEDDIAIVNNTEAIRMIKLVPRVARNVKDRDLSIELLGRRQTMPLAVAPTGACGLLWYQGEVELARAAAAAGIPFTLATGSMSSIETIAEAAAGSTLWFQIYFWENREYSYQLLDRVKGSPYDALVVTVDTAVPAKREYNVRNGFGIPFAFNRTNVLDVALHPGWALRVLGRYLLNGGMPKYENYPAELRTRITGKPLGGNLRNDTFTWEELKDIRRRWPRRLIVKGILDPGDAREAVQCGADAVIVSNHGGRQLDSSISPIDALAAIVEEVGNQIPVLVDGGFRRGSDVVKALAIGASAVLTGRPMLYGIAVDGQAGAAMAMEFFRDEISRSMALSGCARISDITAELLRPARRLAMPTPASFCPD